MYLEDKIPMDSDALCAGGIPDFIESLRPLLITMGVILKTVQGRCVSNGEYKIWVTTQSSRMEFVVWNVSDIKEAGDALDINFLKERSTRKTVLIINTALHIENSSYRAELTPSGMLCFFDEEAIA